MTAKEEKKHQPVQLTTAEVLAHIESFITATAENKRKETAGTYKRALQEFIAFVTMSKNFLFLPENIQEYRESIARKGFSQASLATYMTAVRRFLDYLVQGGILQANPAAGIHGGRRPQSHSRSFLTLPEVEKLLSSFDLDMPLDARDNAIVRLMLGCGCSESEIRSMDTSDLRQGVDGWELPVQGKGKLAKDEIAYIPLSVVEAIEHYLKSRDVQKKEGEALFVSSSNRSRNSRMTVRGIRQAVIDRIHAADIHQGQDRKLSPFSIRHTCGLLLAEWGHNAEEVRRRLRIEWLPTAALYVRQKGKLKAENFPASLAYIALD